MNGDFNGEIPNTERELALEEKPQRSVPEEEKPQGLAEVKTVEVIGTTMMDSPENPDLVFQNITNMEMPILNSIDLTSVLPNSETEKQETNAEKIFKVQDELCVAISAKLSETDNQGISEFATKFNQENKGLLIGQEFRLLKADGEKVVIVDEKGDLKEIIINKNNAKEILLEVKINDKDIKGKSYELRREILHRSAGTINTYEAYTYGVDLPRGAELDIYLDNPENWTVESREINQKIIETEYQKAKSLAKRLDDEIPTTYTVRGNIASGKTTAMRNDSLFRRAIGSDGEAIGAIAPDVYKAALREVENKDGKQDVDHRQVHAQSSMISRAVTERLLRDNSSILIDKMMHEQSSIDKLVSTATIENGREIKMLDLDVPLETSCLRVLGRATGGVDPLIPFDSIAEGYKKIRGNRLILIDKVVKDNPKIKEYTLLVTDNSGNPQPVLKKENGAISFVQGTEQLFEKAITPVTDSEVSSIANILIDDVYISKVLSNTSESHRPKLSASLERYKGYTMKQALDLHSGLAR